MITFLISIKSSMENHSTFCRNVSISGGIVKPKIPALFPSTGHKLQFDNASELLYYISYNDEYSKCFHLT